MATEDYLGWQVPFHGELINMMKKIIILFSMVVMANSACAQQSDFDTVCGYFNALQGELKTKTLSNKDKASYISAKVNKNLKADNPAREAFELVLQANEKVRYELYQTSAQEVTKQKWDCGDY